MATGTNPNRKRETTMRKVKKQREEHNREHGFAAIQGLRVMGEPCEHMTQILYQHNLKKNNGGEPKGSQPSFIEPKTEPGDPS